MHTIHKWASLHRTLSCAVDIRDRRVRSFGAWKDESVISSLVRERVVTIAPTKRAVWAGGHLDAAVLLLLPARLLAVIVLLLAVTTVVETSDC